MEISWHVPRWRRRIRLIEMERPAVVGVK